MQPVAIYKCSHCSYEWSAVVQQGFSPQNCPKCKLNYFEWVNYDDLEASGIFEMSPDEISGEPSCKIKIGT